LNTSSGVLLVATATVSNGACGTFGSFTTLASNPTSPYTDSLTIRTCYEFEYQISDNVGNTATYTSSNVVSEVGMIQDISDPQSSAVDSFSIPGTFTAGDTLILQVEDQGTTYISSHGSVSGGGATWAAVSENNSNGNSEIWYGTAIGTTNSTPVTVTWGNSFTTTVQLADLTEWSGLANTWDTHLSSFGSGTVVGSGLTINDAKSPDLVISGGYSTATDTSAPAPSGSFTALTETAQSGDYQGYAAYEVDNATGSVGVTWTTPTGSWCAAIASFNFSG